MMRALHGALTGLGHRVDVVSLRRPDPYGFTVCDLPFDGELTFGPEKRKGETRLDELSPATLASMATAAAEKIAHEVFRRELPDLLVANHINLMALACWHLHRKYGIPYRVISYGTDTKMLLQDRRHCDLFKDAARDAERIFAISAYVAREVVATVGTSVEVLGGAVDPDLFFPTLEPPKVGKSLIYFGRLVTEKGIWILFEAMAKQKAATELVLVGEGPLREQIASFVASAPLKCQIKLLDYVPPARLREVLIKSSAAVVPSIWEEPLGLVVLEALACGLPVIASAVGGIPEMIEHGTNGFLVPANDPTALANSIDGLLGNQALYEQIQHNVRTTSVPSYRSLALRLIQ